MWAVWGDVLDAFGCVSWQVDSSSKMLMTVHQKELASSAVRRNAGLRSKRSLSEAN